MDSIALQTAKCIIALKSFNVHEIQLVVDAMSKLMCDEATVSMLESCMM